MFDSDREMAAWFASFKARRCDRGAVAEAEDRLRSDIEQLRAEGMPEERAFETATSTIGSAADLDAEYDKNRSPVSRVHRAFAPFDHPLSGRGANGRPKRRAIIGATLIITAAVVLADVDGAEAGGYLLTVFVPLWLASIGLLGRR